MVTVGVIIVTIKGLMNLFAEKYSVYLQKSLPSGYQWHKEAAAGLCFFLFKLCRQHGLGQTNESKFSLNSNIQLSFQYLPLFAHISYLNWPEIEAITIHFFSFEYLVYKRSISTVI